MSVIKSGGYTSIDDFRKDFEVYRANPQDRVLQMAITQRVNSSSPQLIAEINDEMVNAMMESNPQAFIRHVRKDVGPNKIIVIKSATDPFFEV